MADLTAEQKKVLEEQKANCPFCQIIAGKIPANKVYEDSKVFAILDINPAREGHLLVMTKEHYPILPLIPKDQFDSLFSRLKDIIEKAKKGVLLCDSSNYFIANGGAAGQQSPHFMIHVIPRDKNDKFKNFEISKKSVDAEKMHKLSAYMKANLPKLMGERFEKYKLKHPVNDGAGNDTPDNKIIERDSGLSSDKEKQERMEKEDQKHAAKLVGQDDGSAKSGSKPTEEESQKIDLSKITKEDVLKLLDNNPMLKDIIINAPQDAKEVISENEKLAKIFSGIDIDELSHELKHPRKSGKHPEKTSDDHAADVKKHVGKDKDDEINHSDASGNPENRTSSDGDDGDDDGADLDLISRLF